MQWFRFLKFLLKFAFALIIRAPILLFLVFWIFIGKGANELYEYLHEKLPGPSRDEWKETWSNNK